MTKLLSILSILFICSTGWGQISGGSTGGPVTINNNGGGSTPAGPAFAVQFANGGVNALQADPSFTVDPTNHILNTSAGNYVVGAMDSVPRHTFDPMNTARLGGLAAALAGSSGHTPAEVIQATLDYAECQTYPSSWSRVILPAGLNIPIGQVLVWTHQELSGELSGAKSFFIHNDTTKPMVMLHKPTDTITCPGLGTVTPGQAGTVVLRHFGISGLNGSSTDIGIELASGDGNHCFGCRVSDIAGGGTTFGGQGILLLGTSVFSDHLGYEDAQIQGCSVYTHGTEPVSNSPTGKCGAVEDDVLDGELDYVYSSDGAQFLSGKGPGSCYPNCSGFVFGGSNGHANKVFTQVSDVGAILGGTSVRFNDFRIDATSMEGIMVTGGSNIINGVHITAPCTSTSLQAAYNAGTPTPCYGLRSGFGFGINSDNYMTDVHVSLNGGIFGQSFARAKFADFVGPGAAPDHYDFTGVGNANNQTSNDLPLITTTAGGNATPIVNFQQGLISTLTSGGTANISGVSELLLGTSTPLSSVTNAFPGQIVTIYASFGQGTATINNAPAIGTGVVTCTGQPITVTSIQGAIFQFSLNNLSELGCSGPAATPQSTLASSETVTFSATPTFSTAKRASIITLTGNITSFTLASGADGQEKTLTFCQDATGGRTLAGPANVRGLFPSGIGGSASLCNSQHFTYSTAQAAWLADSVGIINQ